ncbi:hypothetical protein CPL66_29330, partial [Klebsiella pneumoniae]|uniref:beta-galactosidase domain 4-containing protein n=1 Tax=Staphylococcus aureus TaxID=1280 RepID=UPI000BC903C1
DNELLHWMVALDGKPLASGEVPLDVAPQGKQLIELPELPQPESAGQLWLTVRVVQYLFRHSDNELLHWMVALDGKPLASGEVPLDVAPQGKQL